MRPVAPGSADPAGHPTDPGDRLAYNLRHRPGIENAIFSESIREEYLFRFLLLDNRASDGSEVAGEIQPARLRPSMAHGHEAEAA